MFSIIGIGEILWDLLPEGKRPGGAPANFAYVANALGNRGSVLSRVGNDPPGMELLDELSAKNLSTATVQIDDEHPTGAVRVTLDGGQPSYEIAADSAWDHLELSESWREIASDADAVCFGSLAQRREVSRSTIHEIVRAVKSWRIFDVNLRRDFYSPEILRRSLSAANVVKLNHEELPVVAGIFELESRDPSAAAQGLISRFDLKLVCITRGAGGSLLISKAGVSENAGLKTNVADTIGAGDAFTAALAHGLLRGWELDKINAFANRVGAFVASKAGAMPEFPEELKG